MTSTNDTFGLLCQLELPYKSPSCLSERESRLRLWQRSKEEISMASEPIFIISTTPSTFRCGLNQAAASRARLKDFWALTKPEVNSLIVIATFAGFCMAYGSRSGALPILVLVHTLFGTLLVASGAGTLNQYFERHFDAQMRR